MLEVKKLTAAYGASTVLRGVSFRLESGEKCALIGANGAGKTTLLRALLGVTPSEGEVTLGDTALTEKTLGQLRRRMGLVFQNPEDQLFLPTVGEDVAFGLENMGITGPERDRRVAKCLEELGAGHLRDRSALSLSGGEKRMAALATVLVMEPEAVLLDEPTAFLDPGARRRLLETLKALPQTMLIATHDLSFALGLCSRAILLCRGEILAEGPCRELLYDRETMARGGVEDIRTFYGGI